MTRKEQVQLKAEMEVARAKMTRAIEKYVDKEAKARRWDNIKSARAGAGVPLDGSESEAEVAIYNEALALAKWDRAVWAKSAEIEAEVLSGVRVMPTIEELLAELPSIEL